MIMHLPMARLIIPTCVIYAYSIIIPIVKWDIFEDMFLNPKDLLAGDEKENLGIYTQMKLLGYTSI
jgi:hypothetical protein